VPNQQDQCQAIFPKTWKSIEDQTNNLSSSRFCLLVFQERNPVAPPHCKIILVGELTKSSALG